MGETKFKVPTVYVSFGITGNLFKTKILKSLFDLYLKDQLPKKFVVVGFSRREWDDNDLRDYLLNIKSEAGIKQTTSYKIFINSFTHVNGTFEDISAYKKLRTRLGANDKSWQYCSNKLFHLAVPPNYYQTIIENLKKSRLTKTCSDKEGWTRVIIEKPFGRDAESAKNLDKLLFKYFKEKQIYRIDHYLGKESLQNILYFRFSNNLFENSWNSNFIESIKITNYESELVDTRGTFYDGVGELRDMGQSHLLQMLSLVTMENPVDLTGDKVRENRAKVLDNLKTLNTNNIRLNTKRSQYIGFKKSSGVKFNSRTETYFKLKLYLKSKRWKNVPIVIESGKGTSKSGSSKIEVIYKQPTPCFCQDETLHNNKNKITFELKPKNEIRIHMWFKNPGLKNDITKKTYKFPYPKEKNRAEDYEKLMYDCIMGDQTLFVSSKEVIAMWKFIDPILKAWKRGVVPLNTYKIGTLPN
jgi:glucose-6-phosphate 1-dehydrogenase